MDYERDTGVDFLRGNQITWHELGLRYDVERDISGRLMKQVQSDLNAERSVRINLFHSPGAGGTTVARRLIWDMHRSYPCGILSNSKPRETVERLQRIVTLTGLPVLILADGSEVSSGELDELFEYVRAYHLPIVIIQVLRSFKPDRTRPRNARAGLRTHFLDGELSVAECNRFAHVLSQAKPPKTSRFETYCKQSAPSSSHTLLFLPSGLW